MAIELFTRHFLGVFFLLIGVLFSARALGLYARLGYSQKEEALERLHGEQYREYQRQVPRWLTLRRYPGS